MAKLFLTAEQINRLLRLAEPQARDHALFHVALSTGFRVSDMVRIRKNDLFDSDGGIVRSIRMKMQKTGVYVERPLRNDCRAAIAKYLLMRIDKNPYLFCAESNNQQRGVKPLDRSSVHRIYRKYLELMFLKSELRGNSCHITRRSMAKLISLKAGRIEPVTEWLGHSTVASTMHYIDRDSFSRQADDIVASITW